MAFPVEDEPDGDRFGPHHYIQGMLAIALAAIAASPDAMLALTGVAIGLFGWYHAWYLYPRLGASLSGVGLVIAGFGLLKYPAVDTWLILGAAGWFASLDDYTSHAVGWGTPLDLFWRDTLAPLILK